MNIIYKTTNLINGKIYVGKHIQDGLEFDGYLGSGTLLLEAIKEFGKENFIRETLEVTETERIAYQRENYWVNELKCCDKDIGYNQVPGGEGFTSESAKELNSRPEIIEMHRKKSTEMWQREGFKEKTSQAISEARLGDPELLKNQSDLLKSLWGDPITREHFLKKRKEYLEKDETKLKMSKISSERQNTPKAKQQRSKISTDLWKNEEFREKTSKAIKDSHINNPEIGKIISEKSTSRWQDPVFREKTLDAMKLAQNRPEVLQKRSESAINMWNDLEFREKHSIAMKKLSQDPEHVKKILETRKRGKENGNAIYHFVLKSPNGEIFETDCLSEFCREHNLKPTGLSRVVNNDRKQYKGWTSVSKELRNK